MSRSVVSIKNSLLCISVLAALTTSCTKSDSNTSAPAAKTAIPNELSGEFKAKALADKSALPSEDQVNSVFLPIKKSTSAMPDISLFQDEKKLETLSAGEEKTKLEASVKAQKAKKNQKQLDQQKQLVENCLEKSESPRVVKNGELDQEGSTLGATVVQKIISASGKQCAVKMETRIDFDMKVTEANKEANLVGMAGSGTMNVKLENVDQKLIDESGLIKMTGNISLAGAIKTVSSEFGGGSKEMHIRAEINAASDFVENKIEMVGGAEMLVKNDDSSVEIYLKVSSNNVVMSVGIMKSATSEMYLLNGNEYQKEEFSKALNQLFAGLSDKTKTENTTGLKMSDAKTISDQVDTSVQFVLNSLLEKIGQLK